MRNPNFRGTKILFYSNLIKPKFMYVNYKNKQDCYHFVFCTLFENSITR
jgi:hypothetical protein